MFSRLAHNLGIPRLRNIISILHKFQDCVEQNSRSSVVRAPTAKIGGLGSDSKWLPRHFFSQFVSMLILLRVRKTDGTSATLSQRRDKKMVVTYHNHVRFC